jgi:hypothetical protein
MATVLSKGIKVDDYRKVQTTASPKNSSKNAKGAIVDFDGAVFTATSGLVAYKIDGLSYTANGALLVNTGNPPPPGGAEMHKGMMFDKTGKVFLSTLTEDALI